MEWTAIIGGVVALIGIVLKLYLTNQKKKETYDYAKQRFDKALADRNVDAISAQFDALREPGSSDPGRPDDKVTP